MNVPPIRLAVRIRSKFDTIALQMDFDPREDAFIIAQPLVGRKFFTAAEAKTFLFFHAFGSYMFFIFAEIGRYWGFKMEFLPKSSLLSQWRRKYLPISERVRRTALVSRREFARRFAVWPRHSAFSDFFAKISTSAHPILNVPCPLLADFRANRFFFAVLFFVFVKKPIFV